MLYKGVPDTPKIFRESFTIKTYYTLATSQMHRVPKDKDLLHTCYKVKCIEFRKIKTYYTLTAVRCIKS